MSKVTFRALNRYGIDVDQFTSRTDIGFLSHFHSDHTNGLDTFLESNRGIIYCSEVTKRLVMARHPKISTERFTVISPNENLVIPNILVSVTVYNANHCAGSLMFLFTTPRHERILYTGDFRFERNTFSYDFISEMFSELNNVDQLYIDTTFAHEYYLDLPTRNESIDIIINLIQKNTKRRVVLCFDVLGSETILIQLSQRLNVKFYLDSTVKPTRRVELEMLCKECLTSDHTSKYHVTIKENLPKLSEIDNLLILPSTMWSIIEWEQTFGMMDKTSCKKVKNFHYVIFSMHSSLQEARFFVEKVNPKKMHSNLQNSFDTSLLVTKNKKRLLQEEDVSPKEKRVDTSTIQIVDPDDLLSFLE
jgi:DNA cross-link repair 1A protein